MKKLLIFEEFEFSKLKIEIIARVLEIFIKEYDLSVDLNPNYGSEADKKLDQVIEKIEKGIDFLIDNMDDD